MAVVLIGTNRDSGQIVEVGLYESADDAHPYVCRNGGGRTLYSVWTPALGSVIKADAMTGRSLPPE